jgi:autotransporter-associated beta strand protein
LAGSNTYTGGTLVSGGTLQIGNGTGGEFLASPTVSLTSTGAALVFSNSDSLTYGGAISGIGSLTETSTAAGALTLTGSNTYSGGTIISGGILQVGSGSSGASISNSGSVLLAGGGSLVFDLPNATTFSGAVSGVGNLTQAGTGLLTLTGSNSASGLTTVSAGTLQLGSGGATGALAGSIYIAGGTFVLDRSGTLSNSVYGSGSLVKTGTDTVTLSNVSGLSGPINVVQGQLVVTSSAASSAFTASSGGTLQLNGIMLNFATLPFPTVTAGSGGVIQVNGTTLLGNPYIDTTNQTGGVIQYQNANVYGGSLFGNGLYQITAGSTASTFNNVVNHGTLQQNGAANFIEVQNYGLITGSGGLLLLGGMNQGGGTLTLSGTNTTSQWEGNNGFVVIQSGGLLNNLNGNLTNGGGQFTINSGGTLNTDSAQQGYALNIQDSLVTNNGTIVGTTNVGYGATLAGSGSSGTVNVSSGGTVAVTGGTLQSASVVLGSASTSPASGAAISGHGVLAGAATIVTTATVTPTAALTLTLDDNLSGSGQLIETGAGKLVLIGSNTYLGGTTISSGTMAVAAASSLALGGLTFNGAGSGVLDVTGSNPFSLTEAVTLSSSGTIRMDDIAAATFSGTIQGSGALLKTGAGELILSGTNSYRGGTVVSAGTLEVTQTSAFPEGTSLTVGPGGALIFGAAVAAEPLEDSRLPAASSVSPAVVPEPGTLALLGVAVTAAAAAAWRRRKKVTRG